jgi:O-antigen/teichoic acid export membrane protein
MNFTAPDSREMLVNHLPAGRTAILGIFGRNTFWLWLDLGALRIVTLLAGFFLIRYFGPSEFGLYSTAIAIGFLVNAISDLGLTRYTARAVAVDRREAPPILALSLATTAVFAVVEVVLLCVATSAGNYRSETILAGLLVNNFEGMAFLCSAMLTATLRSRQILPGSVLSTLGLITLSLLVIFLHLSVAKFVTLGIFRSLAVLGVRLWQLRDFWPGRQWWHWDVFRRVIIAAGPFFSYNMTQVGYGRVSIVCFGIVASPELVGLFSAAFVLSDIFPQWSYAASGALLPLWTRLYENNRIHELIDLRESLLEILVLMSMPMAVLLSVFAPEISRFFGPRFAAASPVLRIVAYRSLLSVIDGFVGHGFLIAINQVKQRQRAQALALAILCVLTLVLGRIGGSQGAAYALFVADAILIGQYLGILSRLNLTIRCPFFGPSLFAGALMAFTALQLPTNLSLWLRAIAALLVYAAVLLMVSRRHLLGAGRTLRHCLSGG